MELFLFVIGILGIPMLFLISRLNKELLSIIVFSFLIVTIICLIVIVMGKQQKDYPVKFQFTLYLMLLSYLFNLFFMFIKHDTLEIIIVFLFVMSFLYADIMFVFYLLNFFYFLGLKRMFPSNYSQVKGQYINSSVRKLAAYMELHHQKAYYNIDLINRATYFLFVIFMTLLVTKYIDSEYGESFGELSRWSAKQGWINFPTLLSAISLLLAIYTITIPAQMKIIREARERCADRFVEYIN